MHSRVRRATVKLAPHVDEITVQGLAQAARLVRWGEAVGFRARAAPAQRRQGGEDRRPRRLPRLWRRLGISRARRPLDPRRTGRGQPAYRRGNRRAAAVVAVGRSRRCPPRHCTRRHPPDRRGTCRNAIVSRRHRRHHRRRDPRRRDLKACSRSCSRWVHVERGPTIANSVCTSDRLACSVEDCGGCRTSWSPRRTRRCGSPGAGSASNPPNIPGIVAFIALSVVLTWRGRGVLARARRRGTRRSSCGGRGGCMSACSASTTPVDGSALRPEGTYLAAPPARDADDGGRLPFTAFAGPIVTYGALVLVTLAAAGILAWRLGLSMGLGTAGSWTAGIL